MGRRRRRRAQQGACCRDQAAEGVVLVGGGSGRRRASMRGSRTAMARKGRVLHSLRSRRAAAAMRREGLSLWACTISRRRRSTTNINRCRSRQRRRSFPSRRSSTRSTSPRGRASRLRGLWVRVGRTTAPHRYFVNFHRKSTKTRPKPITCESRGARFGGDTARSCAAGTGAERSGGGRGDAKPRRRGDFTPQEGFSPAR